LDPSPLAFFNPMELKLVLCGSKCNFLYPIELLFPLSFKKPNKTKGFVQSQFLIKVCPFEMHFNFSRRAVDHQYKKASGSLACKVRISPGCGWKTRGLSPRKL
jgi:hypothetical protein